jgi:nitrogen fixation-related uncharacterized protein
MRLLFTIAVCCCAMLVAAAASMWWSIRSGRYPDGRSTTDDMRRPRNQPHPRMDLAAGIAAGTDGLAQDVGEQRRRGAAPDPTDGATAATAMAAAKAAHPERSDWAFYNENMGDLSDPDARRNSTRGVR